MGKIIDLTNKKFGRLTVIKQAERQNGKIAWLCKCECGKEVIVKGDYLRYGYTKSCGCLKKEVATERAKTRAKSYNLIGQHFGELTVVEDSGKRASDGSIYWRCSCSCGNKDYLIVSSELKRTGDRAKKHCNNTIHQIKDLKGQKFGFLEVIEIDKTTIGSGKIYWLCKCHNCNRQDLVSVKSNSLLMNKNHTCGCGCIMSFGAKKIKDFLDTKDIPYIAERTEITLVNPKTNNKLRFDFYIPNYKDKEIYIEYDGEQHFYFSSGWNTKTKVLHTRYLDSLKNEWCLENKKFLYRIPYYDINKINSLEDILQEEYLVKTIDHYNLEEDF